MNRNSDSPHAHACACPCGQTRFAAQSRPFARIYCHCLICQRLYRKPFADVCILWARSLEMPADADTRVARYRSWPALDRTVCMHCELPVLGVFRLGPLRTLAFVPSSNFAHEDELPKPAAHLFYHRRAADHNDGLPKYHGYWRSEFGVGMIIARGLTGGG